MSRTRTLVLLATVAVLALAFAACGGGGDDSDTGGTGGGSSDDAQQVLDNATFEGVESGNVNLSLSFKANAESSGSFDVSLSGPFQTGAAGALPEADMDVSVDGETEGENINFEGSATLLSDRAYIGYEGEDFEVDPTTFGYVKSSFEQAQQESGGESAGAKACQQAAAEIDIGNFFDEVESEGGQDVEGTSTTEVSGDVDITGAIDAITKLTEAPACASQFEMAGPLGAVPAEELEKSANEVEAAVKKAHAAVYVGDDDNIVRKVTFELEFDDSGETVDVSFDLSLGEVNEEQTISAPANAKPLEQLFQKIGVNPLELLEGGGAGGLGGLLEGIQGGSSEGGSSEELPEGGATEELPESGSDEELPDDLPQEAQESHEYLQCLEGAETPADLQKCASLLP